MIETRAELEIRNWKSHPAIDNANNNDIPLHSLRSLTFPAKDESHSCIR